MAISYKVLQVGMYLLLVTNRKSYMALVAVSYLDQYYLQKSTLTTLVTGNLQGPIFRYSKVGFSLRACGFSLGCAGF